MPKAEKTLAKWSHHEAGTDFKQAHVPIREALEAHKRLSQFEYKVFLQVPTRTTRILAGTATSTWSSG